MPPARDWRPLRAYGSRGARALASIRSMVGYVKRPWEHPPHETRRPASAYSGDQKAEARQIGHGAGASAAGSLNDAALARWHAELMHWQEANIRSPLPARESMVVLRQRAATPQYSLLPRPGTAVRSHHELQERTDDQLAPVISRKPVSRLSCGATRSGTRAKGVEQPLLRFPRPSPPREKPYSRGYWRV